MTRIPMRGRAARLAVGLAALGVPLLGANSAQAALGTSNTFVPQNRPALVSVTDQGGTGLVNFCFQTSGGQAITAPPGGYVAANFSIRGYDESTENDAATVAQLNNNCVQATFASGEIGEYSIGRVLGTSVVAIIAGNPVGNLSDGAPLIGSSSNNGTRGFTDSLDLVNVLSPGSNRLAFIFDQDVNQDALAAGCPGAGCGTRDFMFYDGAGALHGNTAVAQAIISVSDNVVVVQYTNPPDPVADARIGVVRSHAQTITGGPTFTQLEADTPFGADQSSLGSAAVAGVAGSGNTSLIEPTGAALVNGGNSNQIDFTFETNVALGPGSPDCFTATSSNNKRTYGDAASVSGNVVTVTFNGMQLFTEQMTRAGIQSPDPSAAGPGPQPSGSSQAGFTNPQAIPAGNCVQSTTGAVGNTMAGLPIGGNVGAVATGYTTGPEALAGVTRSGGNVTVPVDARVDPGNLSLGDVNLLDDQGNVIGGTPSSASVTGNGSPTDPHAVTFTFDPVAVAAARGMQLFADAISTFPDPDVDEVDNEVNVTQVFALP